MIAAILKDTLAGERRVAMIPASLAALAKLGIETVVETGAGDAAGFPDAAYVEKGARVVGVPRGGAEGGRPAAAGPPAARAGRDLRRRLARGT